MADPDPKMRNESENPNPYWTRLVKKLKLKMSSSVDSKFRCIRDIRLKGEIISNTF